MRYYSIVRLFRALLIAITVVTMSGCSMARVVVHRQQLDSARVAQLNALLHDADVEVELRGRATPHTFQERRRARLSITTVELIGERDTFSIPIEYVAIVRGSHPRSGGRLAIGTAGGLLLGTAMGIVLSPAAPLQIGIAGALCGLTAAALLSEQFIIRFE
jgi:hypothetical protein